MMQFLKTLFWVTLAITLVLFSSFNWKAVTIALWGGLEADVKLPILIIAMFLIGFLPMLILHRTKMWAMKRRLETLEKQTGMLNTPTVDAPSADSAIASVQQPFNTRTM